MTVVSVLALSTLWLVVVLRLRSLRGTAQQRAATLAFLFFVLSGTLALPGVRHAVDTAASVPDLAILLGHLSALAAITACLQLGVVLNPARRRMIRRGQLALAAGGAGMVGLFLALPRRLDQPDFGYWHARDAAVVSYQMIFQSSLVLALACTVLLLVPHWRAASRGPLRKALFLLVLSAVLGIAYTGCRVWYVLAHGFGLVARADRPVYGAVTFLLLYSALLTAGVGALVRWGHRSRGLLRRYADYHRLRRLWSLLTEAVPSAVLEPPPPVLLDVLWFRGIELRLYRRVVEIRDAQLEVISHVPQHLRDVAAAALREAGVHDDLALDACTLLVALDLRGRTRPETPGAVAWAPEATLDAETKTLLALDGLLRDATLRGVASAVLLAEAAA